MGVSGSVVFSCFASLRPEQQHHGQVLHRLQPALIPPHRHKHGHNAHNAHQNDEPVTLCAVVAVLLVKVIVERHSNEMFNSQIFDLGTEYGSLRAEKRGAFLRSATFTDAVAEQGLKKDPAAFIESFQKKPGEASADYSKRIGQMDLQRSQIQNKLTRAANERKMEAAKQKALEKSKQKTKAPKQKSNDGPENA